jgi:single-strand DNA-binding protein
VSSVNKSIIIGHLGKDPDIRTSPSGAKVASLSIATSDNPYPVAAHKI